MQRPQSLEFKGVKRDKPIHLMPAIISYELKSSEKPTQRLWPLSITSTQAHDGHYSKPNYNVSFDVNRIENRHSTRITNLDQQVCQLNRMSNQNNFGTTQRFYSGLPQSQSFNQNIYQSPMNTQLRNTPTASGDNNHTSRLISSTYMSPPPVDWTTIGNIIPVKRSTSMPGYRGINSSTLNKNFNQQMNQNQVNPKKKSGAFQCLKHQLKKSGIKIESNIQSNTNSIDLNVSNSVASITTHKPYQIGCNMSSSVHLPKSNEKSKPSRSIFKKKPVVSPNTPQNTNVKPRGIKKSISLLFSSKSYRTVKSDPSNLDQTNKINESEKSVEINSQQLEREFSFKSAARINHSYESMLHDDKTCSLSLYTDTNRSNSYTSVDDNSSVDYSNSTGPGKIVGRVRTPSDSSLPDTASLCSSGHNIFTYNNQNQYKAADQYSIAATSCHGNINYRATDNVWKTVVGNVCRSNSKDSAIANSTLSADGMLSQSKRMSQISTLSRTSDITQTSEDFNDSSYSSFNDLQIHASQVYQKKKRIKSVLPKLQSVELESNQPESMCSYDNSPFSDSSTETLRPLSCLLRRKLLSSKKDSRPFHSDTIIKQTKFHDSIENFKSKSLRHSHSWPSCIYQSLCKSISSPRTFINQLLLKPRKTNTTIASKLENHPHLKFPKLNPSRINNSPLLSQYSRLYSLKSAGVQQQFGLSNFSGHITSSIEPPVSPIKFSSRAYQHFPP